MPPEWIAVMRKHLLALPAALALVLAAAPATAAPLAAADVPSFASAKNDKPKKAKPVKPKPPKATSPGSSKGGNPPAHSNGNGRDQAPGQLKKAPGAAPSEGDGDSNADPRSENENKKVTYCHVPPGNPDNGRLITTSVNAIDPGHTNHPGDIIPPFTFVKHGETVSFPGQNWGPDAQAILDNGCRTPGTEPGGVSGEDEDPAGEPTDEPAADEPEVKGASLTADVADESLVDAILPSTGGARLGLLLGALALLGAGGLLLRRRAATEV